MRLLFFWVGKDDVGGGHIAYSEIPGSASNSTVEAIEVLFGSSPERVPGKINRWGYGEEIAQWLPAAKDHSRCLAGSVFEGFIRHSSEESMSDVQNSDKNAKSQSEFWYDAIVSQVTSRESRTEIWKFSDNKDFDYRNLQPVMDAYQHRRGKGPADRVELLDEKWMKARQPFGFLTAVQQLMREIAGAYAAKAPRWRDAKYEHGYSYNAKAYRVRVTRISFHQSVANLNFKGLTGTAASALNNVAETDFELTNEATQQAHRFSVWFPLNASERLMPLRIVDKPRWWLQVELNLAGHERRAKAWPVRRLALERQLAAAQDGTCGGTSRE